MISVPAEAFIVQVSPILPYRKHDGTDVHFAMLGDVVYISKEKYDELKARALRGAS